VRDAANNVLYRAMQPDLIDFRAEFLDAGDLLAPDRADVQGEFELVFPVLARAVTLLIFGPPLDAVDRTVASDVIMTFDLTKI
jgi:hypothetical protein